MRSMSSTYYTARVAAVVAAVADWYTFSAGRPPDV
jgi:hypothetical protein